MSRSQMGMDNTNIGNILQMIVEIKTNPRQSDRDIYTTLGFSRAAFYKYRKLLAEKLGFAFSYSRSRRQFVIEADPFIPTLNLTLGEFSALVHSMGQLAASGGDFLVCYRAFKAVQKLISQCPQHSHREQLTRLLSETLYNHGYGCREEVLDTLERAIDETDTRKVLRIRYYSASSQAEHVAEVAPYILYFKKRALYMDAYSLTHDEIRMFRVSRIREATLLPGSTDASGLFFPQAPPTCVLCLWR